MDLVHSIVNELPFNKDIKLGMIEWIDDFLEVMSFERTLTDSFKLLLIHDSINFLTHREPLTDCPFWTIVYNVSIEFLDMEHWLALGLNIRTEVIDFLNNREF